MSDFREEFSNIHNWVVANGNKTHQSTPNQIFALLLCKEFDDRQSEKLFWTELADLDSMVEERINRLWTSATTAYPAILSVASKIEFNGKTLRYIVDSIQDFPKHHRERDILADAYEVLVDNKTAKYSEGQFFTPRNIINVILSTIPLRETDRVLDTACGSGGFLVEVLRQFSVDSVYGIEKDPHLAKLSNAYVSVVGAGKGCVFHEDALDDPSKWASDTQRQVQLGSFDVVIANPPPFGKNIRVSDKEKLSQFRLAHKPNNQFTLATNTKISTLFLERNMQLLKDGGKLGIILPEPYFALSSYGAIRQFIFEHNIQWVIDIPQNTFRPYNNAKCCAIIIEKNRPQQEFINMAVVEYMGHDHQGRPIDSDDTKQVMAEIRGEKPDRPMTFKVEAQTIKDRDILVPRFYWDAELSNIRREAQQDNETLIQLQTLIDEGIIDCFSGHGSPDADAKGQGDIPYIRVKDIVNWQPYVDVTALIPRFTYDRYFRKSKTLFPKDILYVSRGSYRIGSVAMVSPYDGEMLLTKEINVIRMIKHNNKYGITPEYLLYALSHRNTWRQIKNKVFYEPCLPNIADRWKEIYIPIPNDKETFDCIKQSVAGVIEDIWKAKQNLAELKNSHNLFMT